jgi:hypothetical protein
VVVLPHIYEACSVSVVYICPSEDISFISFIKVVKSNSVVTCSSFKLARLLFDVVVAFHHQMLTFMNMKKRLIVVL